jgi:DNA-binding transcriptional LysR family regulator
MAGRAVLHYHVGHALTGLSTMRLHGLDLNRLVALDALLNDRSVSRAAERMYLSQPAMSAVLASLREHFGDPLLTPAGASMQPTPFALELTGPVRQLVLQARAVSQLRPARDLARLQQRITLVASDATAGFLLAPVMQRAATLAPGLQFDLRPVTEQLTDQFERGEVDMMVAAEEARSSKQPSERLFDAPHACLVCATHPAAQQGTLDLDTYRAAGHVAVCWGGGRIELADAAAARAAGIERHLDVQVPTFSMLPDYLLHTHRIATLPQPYAVHLAKHLPLAVLPCPVPVAPLRGVVQWHRYKQADPALGWLREALHERVAALGLQPDK